MHSIDATAVSVFGPAMAIKYDLLKRASAESHGRKRKDRAPPSCGPVYHHRGQTLRGIFLIEFTIPEITRPPLVSKAPPKVGSGYRKAERKESSIIPGVKILNRLGSTVAV